ncbi:MAG: hypothetical protein IRZ28_20745 [Steroidobacteraceae bacterium]|nr:hypothetical protein [Steroidobacteraceae bacterium]
MAELTEWLKLMLAEIARKREEAERAREEDRRRESEANRQEEDRSVATKRR